MLVDLMKRELLLVYPNIIYYIMLIIFILFLVLYVVKISYRLLDIIEFTLLQSIFFIIIFFWKLFILSYVLIFIFIALCNTLYCLYMYINLQKEEHIDIFKHLCNYSGFIGKGWGALFNLNQRLYQNLNYLIILSLHSLFLAPVVDSTLLFYTVLKWSYEKKTYKLNEGYLLFFKMLLLSLVFGITQRLIYVFNLYKIIFSEYPFYTYMCCITSRKNWSIFNHANKKVYFDKVNPLKPSSSNSTLVQNVQSRSSKLLGYISRDSDLPTNMSSLNNPFNYLFFTETCGKNEEHLHMGVTMALQETCGITPLGSHIFRTTPGQHGEPDSAVVAIHKIVDAKGNSINKTQILSGVFRSPKYRDYSLEANIEGVSRSLEVGQMAATKLFVTGEMILVGDSVLVKTPTGSFVEKASVSKFIQVLKPRLKLSLEEIIITNNSEKGHESFLEALSKMSDD